MKILVLFLYLILASMVVSAQNTYEDNIRAAKKGDADAQFVIGSCYSTGANVEKDEEKAVYWWSKAAKQGHAASQSFLGQAYFTGKGITKDPSLAVYWYRKSAEQGRAAAQCSLALCYLIGKGVEKDNNQAFYWCSKAAEQGHPIAQYWMGRHYSNGWGVVKNVEQAFKWYLKSAEQGDASAQLCLGYCYYVGEGVSKDYSQAVYWMQKSLDNGETKAKDYLDIARKKQQEYETEKKRIQDSIAIAKQDSIAAAKKRQQREDSLALVKIKAHGQTKHLTVLGIPIAGSITAFQQKLLAKNYQLDSKKNKQLPVGERAFNGRFSGHDCSLKAYYFPEDKTVYKVRVSIDFIYESSADAAYTEIKRNLLRKYKYADTKTGRSNGHESLSALIIDEDDDILGSIVLFVFENDDPYESELVVGYEDMDGLIKREKKNTDDL